VEPGRARGVYGSVTTTKRIGLVTGAALLAASVTMVAPVHAQSGKATTTMVRPSNVRPSMVRPRPRPLPPPVLMVVRNQVSRPLQTTKVDIKATIVGHLAETSMTMTFYNPNKTAMAGDLYFPLPQGATVSGYALDIQGRMIDGVVVGKDKGRQVFEKEVRRRVDPGLVEWTKGQNFKTRVFPIPAKGTRTIRVSYVSEVLNLKEGAVYYLPLSFRSKVKKLSIRVEALRAVSKPVVISGGPSGMRFGKTSNSFVARSSLANVVLNKDLYVHLPQQHKRPVRVERAPDGRTYFSIRDLVAPPTARRAAKKPRRIAVYWDASMSRATQDHTKERALLNAYLDTLKRVDVYLVVFRDRAERARRFRLPAQRPALARAIAGVVYDGGTQLGAAVPSRFVPWVDLSLLFTDGISNYGTQIPRASLTPVFAVNVAAGANHAVLRFIALRSGGSYYNLRSMTVASAVPTIGASAYSFISATATGVKVGSLYPNLQTPVHDGFDMAGVLTAPEAKITVNYGYSGKVVRSRTFTIKAADAAKGNVLRRYWAQKKLDDLIVFAERNAKKIAKLGRDFSIVTPGTSLIVLEELRQYVEHKIRPPATWAAMRTKYDQTMATRDKKRLAKKASKLKSLIAMWNTRVKWWNTRFKIPKPKPKRRYKRGTIGHGSGTGRAYGSGAGRAGMRGRVVRAPRVMIGRARVRGMRSRRPSAKPKPEVRPKPQPTIKLKEWDPKTPYVTAIKAAPRARQYSVYLVQRKKYGKSPAFFLDSANYFLKTRRTRLGLRILSNLAELELENPALVRVLAHRLSQLGKYDLSVQLFEQVRKLRPEEPQSFRDLALVLERRGDKNRFRRKKAAKDYRRSLDNLATVVMRKWDRFDQIELIALTELNALFVKAKRFGVTKAPVDKRLIKHLHMDVRIVMSWDADSTDMDLHVIEPTKEEAYYSNNKTKIGGIVSKDFTNGYGPEIYAIRRAMRGKYTIRTKFFGSSAAKLIGAVTLQVDIYTNYGRRNQRRRSLTLRLTKKKETFTVGAIRF